MSTPELQQILELLQKLGKAQEELNVKVDALSARSPPVSALAAPFHSNLSLTRPPSAALAANRALAGGGIETSAPPSPILTGTDNFPVGPVANGPTSPILNGDDELHGLPSPRTGGGVDAFKAKRASSFSTSPTAGTHTPHGTLAAAYTIKGMPAPGQVTPPRKDAKEALYPSRVVLTTYPNQAGVNPIPVTWGAGPDGRTRGPVVCSRIKSNLPLRNAIGALGGSYSIFRALSISMGELRPDWRPDLTYTEPPFQLGPKPGWFGDGSERGEEGNKKGWKIVSFDPWGAMSQEIWAKEYAEGLDVRPTIAQTKAHIKIEELDELARKGDLKVDGDIVIKSKELPAFPGVDQGVEVNCYKAAIDPVWYLPGIAERLGIEERVLRRALFEDTGGMYPELLTRPDIKIFLPPVGGMTVYIMGDPEKLHDPKTEITCRVHDSCAGSDVFGSDICTCRPYLIYGIAEAVRCAQRGGLGVVVYFQKEGRALGEVIKYMVYNRRKRGGDTAAEYFNNTERVAGVKDARHQELMPDVLHWLGITHITNLISMSNMKYDAIINSGITVENRYEIPEHLIPSDGSVEIDAKIQAGYFSTRAVSDELLKKTKGRGWEDVIH